MGAICATTAVAHAGVSMNGASVSGVSLNGTSFNGLSLNGANLNGMSAHGIVTDRETTQVQNMPAATANEASGIALTGARIRIHKVLG